MKIILTVGFIISSIMIYSCSHHKSDTFKDGAASFNISGRVTGMEDSTWLFLQTPSNQIMDSAHVFNGQFSMTGKIPDSVETAQVMLRTKDFRDYKFFWLENSDIKFNGEKGNFRFASITGSKTQSEADAYDAILRPIDKEADSLSKIAREPNNDQITAGKIHKLQAQLDEKRKTVSVNFVIENPNSIVSAGLLDVYSTTWGKEITKEFYHLLTDELRSTHYGKSINRYIELTGILRSEINLLTSRK